MKTSKDLTEEQKQALSAVQKLNNKLHDKLGWDNNSVFISIEIISFHFIINIYIGDSKIRIYSSANPEKERIYYETSDKYEEFYSFIRRRFREIKEDFNNLKL